MAGSTIVSVTNGRGTSATIAFCRLGQRPPTAAPFEQAFGELVPIVNRRRGYPNAHFRHGGLASVAFADGHVETRPVVNNGPPSEDPAATVLRTKEQVWDLSTDDAPVRPPVTAPFSLRAATGGSGGRRPTSLRSRLARMRMGLA